MTLIIPLLESAGDPTAVANNAILYAKDVGGVTQAFFRASDGTLTQISGTPNGTFLGRQVFTAGGTYTPTPGTVVAIVSIVGGGGGGGGTSGGAAGGGGGSSGVFVHARLTNGSLLTGGAVVIGAGGAGGAITPTNGSSGGDSSVVINGATILARGGGGGGSAAGLYAALSGPPASGSTSGDFNTFGLGGEGMFFAGSTWVGGAGGSSPMGAGATALIGVNSAGNPGLIYGGGGGGGANSGAPGSAGGAGAAGKLIIDEYAQGEVPTGLYLGRQLFTAGGTYTPTVGTKKVRVRMVGGGGGAGGGSSTGGVSGGGASGAYFEQTFSPGVAITGGTAAIGIAGAGSGVGTGGAGGDTSIVIQGSTYTAKGGLGGQFNGTVGEKIAFGGSPAASGTSAGDFSFQNPGRAGVQIGTSHLGGDGGDSPMGAGGKGTGTDTGVNGQGYGGGGGGCVDGSFGCTGGNGTAGLIIVDEWS